MELVDNLVQNSSPVIAKNISTINQAISALTTLYSQILQVEAQSNQAMTAEQAKQKLIDSLSSNFGNNFTSLSELYDQAAQDLYNLSLKGNRGTKGSLRHKVYSTAKKFSLSSSLIGGLMTIITNFENNMKKISNESEARKLETLNISALDVLRRGYQTLTLIGEQITTHEVKYEVVYRFEDGGKTVIKSVTLDLNEFLRNSVLTTEGVLKLNEIAMKNLIQTKGTLWSNADTQAYLTLENTVREIELNGYTDADGVTRRIWYNKNDPNKNNYTQLIDVYVNLGNITEALKLARSKIKSSRQLLKVLGDTEAVYHLMQAVLKNTASFITGGDVKNIQLKNLNATITSLSTIKNLTLQLLNHLKQYNNGEKQLNQIRNKLNILGVNKSAEVAKQNAIQEFKKRLSALL